MWKGIPDLPMEPPEPVVFAYCDRCGHEIYEGEGMIVKDGKVYHTECGDDEDGKFEIEGGV